MGRCGPGNAYGASAESGAKSKPDQDAQAPVWAEESPTKPVNPAEPVKKADAAAARITDFGEKLSGARKDVWSSYTDRMAAAGDVDVAAEPLSKSWPAPDYLKLIEAGVEPWKVSLIRVTRDAIPTKPQKSWRVSASASWTR